MNEKETKLIIAAILHDIGKVIYREGNDVRKHSISGYDYLKETGITDKEILDAVKYHHAQSLRTQQFYQQEQQRPFHLEDRFLLQ